MTDVSTNHPFGLPYIELTEQGRRISFRRDCLGQAKIYRKVNQGEWEIIIQHIRPPFVDTEAFPHGTKLSYSIELELNNGKKKYELDVML